MKKGVVVLFSLVLLFSLSFSKDFYLKNYRIKIKVNKDSSLDVEEELTVHFTQKRHGLIRKIPYKYNVTSSFFSESRLKRGAKYKLTITDIKVENNKFKVKRSSGILKIKIGDPEKFVYGDVFYKIRYRVYGGINEFKDHYELYWNVLGGEWGTEVQRFSFVIELPKGAELSSEKVLVFSGALGNKGNFLNVRYRISGNTILSIPAYYIQPGNYVTVVVWIDKNLLSIPLSVKLKVFFINHPFIPLPFILFPILYLLWSKFGRDKKFTLMVYYKPPKDLHPAEAGVLTDDTLDKRDIVSIIINFAVNGILKIKEIDNGKDYELIKLKELPADAKEYEKVFFNGLFENSDSIKVSSLKNKFYKTANKVRKLLDKEIRKESYYTSGTRFFGGILTSIGGFVFIFSIIALFGYGIYDFIALAVSGAMLIVFGRIMPQKTEKGFEKYRVLKGFEEFIEKVEKPVLEKLLKEDPMYFSKYLPYAIVLGLEKKWGKKFEELLKEPPDWYESDYGRGFSTVYFVSRLDSAVSTMNSAFTSSPSGSGASSGSGFSGGGFSGGGFGGGGGDSW